MRIGSLKNPKYLDAHPMGGPGIMDKQQTTSFLTTTTLIYTAGAGITAAAGTRLALQLILINVFETYSFQLQDTYALHCYFLSLPHCSRDWVICAPAASLRCGSCF